eukprot:CAMPEP_0185906358 /NCGR_PEP_ID=MMETSP0196C-20130402/5449_1 /TAXON_ID=2932 /ORGANISM="Alexandrium fundyense, Strain CCMP1719" /LENGTH=48 /DNA_ID= /DNA_START= /DNA_END= /DNA_ORIENTATION=
MTQQSFSEACLATSSALTDIGQAYKVGGGKERLVAQDAASGLSQNGYG